MHPARLARSSLLLPLPPAVCSLAMVGFVAAFGAELFTGKPALSQSAGHGGAVFWTCESRAAAALRRCLRREREAAECPPLLCWPACDGAHTLGSQPRLLPARSSPLLLLQSCSSRSPLWRLSTVASATTRPSARSRPTPSCSTAGERPPASDGGARLSDGCSASAPPASRGGRRPFWLCGVAGWLGASSGQPCSPFSLLPSPSPPQRRDGGLWHVGAAGGCEGPRPLLRRRGLPLLLQPSVPMPPPPQPSSAAQ